MIKTYNLNKDATLLIGDETRDIEAAKKANKKLNYKVTLPCGCEYIEKSWLLNRLKECNYNKQKRTRKKPYRPKAECVRP